MELVDIGVNLTHKSFKNDRDEVITRASDVGVNTMILTGTSIAGSKQALELCENREGFFCTAGVHPHHAAEGNEHTISTLRSLASKTPVVALGECGLDFFRNFSPPEDQERMFEQQLALAVELGLPVFLHQRDAHQRFCDILGKYRDGLCAGVAHCFTGDGQELDAYLEMDLHIGITGWICDERRGLHLRELISRIPANRLMIETDAPFLMPRGMKPKPKNNRNEPALLPHVLAEVARSGGKDIEQVAEETTATARSFFRLPNPGA